jgi:hypothetical protein
MNGKLVFEASDLFEKTLMINAAEWHTGMYFYKLITTDGKLYSGKMLSK